MRQPWPKRWVCCEARPVRRTGSVLRVAVPESPAGRQEDLRKEIALLRESVDELLRRLDAAIRRDEDEYYRFWQWACE